MGTDFLRRQRIVVDIIHFLVLVLSILLIVYISYDTFNDIPFLDNHRYMEFQFWVCIFFLADFFLEWIYAPEKLKYLRDRWFFFFISIPYLNIVNYWDIQLPGQALYYLRFIPLARGAYSLALVMGYISKNRATSLLWQYIALVGTLLYMLALLFYYEEHGINPPVRSFWDALYFVAMNTCTVGCYFNALTPVGKIVSVVSPVAGMLILPVFTVYITNWVQQRATSPAHRGSKD